jgi:hypothetical protein
VCLLATYPLGYASVASLPAALLRGLFEQPARKPTKPKETSVELILPRFVAIDSSTLASWARDAFGPDIERRAFARAAQTSLLNANWTPLICLHHFIELARHSDLEVAAGRIEFLKSFSHIAWLGRSYTSNTLGAIVDIFEAEVTTVLAFPNIDFHDMRRSVREKLVRYGPPTDIKVLNDWEYLHHDLKAMAVREQEIASIVHTERTVNDDVEIAQLRNILIKDLTHFEQSLIDEIAKTTADLTGRGDLRLTDPNHTAREFVSTVASNLVEAMNKGGNAFDAFVEQHDVPQKDITETTTLRQFKQLARMRRLARIAVKQLGLDLDQTWPKLRNAKIPSEVIQEIIRMARKTAPRASGSDLGDAYLACLAPYVDAIIVDKRTHEFMAQGARRDPYFRKMVGFFEKAASYRQLPEVLARRLGSGNQ